MVQFNKQAEFCNVLSLGQDVQLLECLKQVLQALLQGWHFDVEIYMYVFNGQLAVQYAEFEAIFKNDPALQLKQVC